MIASPRGGGGRMGSELFLGSKGAVSKFLVVRLVMNNHQLMNIERNEQKLALKHQTKPSH